tara:strand:+ start:1705 stop:2889 length:1185 start_codon:yes stop_codon:yes gene_type:complete
MLSIANIDVIETLSIFKKYGVSVSFLVPTLTGLEKSIMDATEETRFFLKQNDIHSYAEQAKGEVNKLVLKCTLVTGDESISTKVSLYRPETKDGDPRIWIYGLKKYASQGDLLALISDNNNLIVINCSRTNLIKHYENKISIIHETQRSNLSVYAMELKDKLSQISKKGYIKNLRKGDTGVGYTLETLLGIDQNSSQNPDYKGIEIKSLRKRTKRGTLLSLVPDWSSSNICSAHELVMKRGKKNPKYNNLITLMHTINAVTENSYNLKLLIKDECIHQTFTGNDIEKDVLWDLNILKKRINEKHNETFWVDAIAKGTGNDETFHFEKIIHTSKPDLDIIPLLIKQGSISLDYLLWEKRNDWKKLINKKGFDFLWKIKLKDRDLLFKSINNYDLN